MKALILATDTGTLVDTMPAPLLTVGEEPLLGHTLRWLKRFGITEVAIALDHRSDIIQHTLSDGAAWGISIIYVRAPQGAVDALMQLASFFNETLVVVAGHLLLDVDLAELLDYHRSRHALVTIGLRHIDDPQAHTMAECDSTGRVVRLVKYPATWSSVQRTATAGVDLIEPTLLDHLPTDRLADWEQELLPLLVTAGESIYGQLVTGPLVAIRTPADYERVKAMGLEQTQERE